MNKLFLKFIALRKNFPGSTPPLSIISLLRMASSTSPMFLFLASSVLSSTTDLRTAVNPNQKDRKAFEEAYPGGMYQADTSYTTYIRENGKLRRTYLVHIVDDHSRLIVGARFSYNDNAYNFQIVLKEAIARYGLCHKIYLDNGSTYANAQLSLICGSLGIVKIHTPVRDGASMRYS